MDMALRTWNTLTAWIACILSKESTYMVVLVLGKADVVVFLWSVLQLLSR